MARDGQITDLTADPDGVFVCIEGVVRGFTVPGQSLTLNGKPASAAEILAWWAGVRGGAAFASVKTSWIFGRGVSAAFRSNP